MIDTMMIGASPTLQRAALLGVAACAAIAVGATALYVFGVLAPVIGLFFGGWLLACVLEPSIDWFMRVAHVRRPVAIASAYGFIVVLLFVGWWLAAPELTRQLDATIQSLPVKVDAATRQLAADEAEANAWFMEHGLPLQLDVESALRSEQLGLQADASATNAVAVVRSLLAMFGSFAAMLLLSLFFLIDGPSLAEQAAQSVGQRFAEDVRFVETTVHDAFDGFLRAQLLQAILFAGGVWVCLAVAGVDAAPIVALASGVLLLVPVVGSVLAVALPVLATLLWNSGGAIAVAVLVVLLQQLVLNVIGPRVMSRQSGLPPLLLLFGIFAGGQLGGLWGAVFGIPVLVTVLTCAGHFRDRWSAAQRQELPLQSARKAPNHAYDSQPSFDRSTS